MIVSVVHDLGAPVGLKASAAAIYGWLMKNLSDQPAYVQVFDAQVKDVKLGETKPVFVIALERNAIDKEMPSAGVMPQATTPAVTHLETKKGLTIAATTASDNAELSHVLVNVFLNQ